MKAAMFDAEVGDDVYGEDPSVNALEAIAARLFNREAALFSPSGTMSNQIGIKVHTQPGDEVICEEQAHVYIYEGGGIAFNSGAQVKAIKGEKGLMDAGQVRSAINPDDVHKARTSLVCLENTSNRGGGTCYDLKAISGIRQVCQENNLKLHLDGARLFNALVATGTSPEAYGAVFDSISICLNKGLGCPMGSILIGDAGYIRQARRIRKVFGGGMRQAGYMAAAGIYALENNIPRLETDHQHAKNIAAALERKGFVTGIVPVETNIIIFSLQPPHTPASFVAHMRENGIRCTAISSTQVRMVTHLDITETMVQKTIETINRL